MYVKQTNIVSVKRNMKLMDIKREGSVTQLSWKDSKGI